MKKRVISMVCAFVLIVNISGAAAAVQPRASDYFSCTAVYATAVGGGKVVVDICIDATHTMLEVGATEVYIYEQQSSGTYENVYTFSSEDYYSSMIETNSAFADAILTYQGVSGRKYYALVALYARDSDGSEYIYSTTNIVTA